MKTKFTALFRVYVLVLVAVLLWAVWADAQVATNPPPAATTNAASRMLNSLEHSFGVEKQFFLSFGLDQYETLRQPWLGNPIWKYIASLIYILLAWLASRLVDLIFHQLLKRWTARTETKLDDLLVELAHGPVKIVTFVVLLHIGLNVFDWPGWFVQYLSKGLKLVVAWSITYMAVRAVDVLMRHLKVKAQDEDRAFDAQLFPVLNKGIKVFIVLVALLVTAQNLDFNITGILASLSIGGLALGLAAQDTLANLFGAIAIFADKPFRAGERIRLDTIDGTVERIGLRSTRIRNLEGHLVTVPNKTVGNAAIVNISRRPNIRTIMNLSIPYHTPPDKIRQAVTLLEAVYRTHPLSGDVVVGFDRFTNYALNLQITHYWLGPDDKSFVAAMQEMNILAKQRLDEAGIELAFPTQTHLVKAE
jgi:MscS family membrane protein